MRLKYLLALSLLLSCATLAQPRSDADCKGRVSRCLRDLVRAQAYTEASGFYNRHRAEFAAKEWERSLEDLTTVAAQLNAAYDFDARPLEQRLDALSFDAKSAASWSNVRTELALVETLLSAYGSHELLKRTGFTSPIVTSLGKRFADSIAAIEREALAAFSSYDHRNRPSFFDQYPALPDVGTLTAAGWLTIESQFASSTHEDVFGLVNRWTGNRPHLFGVTYGSERSRAMADLYYRRLIAAVTAARERKYELLFDGISKATEVSLEPSDSARSRMLLSLVDRTAAEPPVVFTDHARLPFTVLNEPPPAEALKSAELMLVVAVVGKEIAERTISRAAVPSTYRAGYEEVVNPDYLAARNAYERALLDFNLANQRYINAQAANSINPTPYNAGAALGAAIAVGAARKQLNSVAAMINQTPPTRKEERYEPYEFTAVTVELSRGINANVAMIVGDTQSIRTATFARRGVDEVRVAQGAREGDTAARRGYVTEAELRRREAQAVEVSVTDALQQLAATDAQTRSTDDLARLLASMFESQRSLATARAAPPAPSATLVAHPALGGVVVVTSPLGGFGSGFFVDERLVLTNHHVVDSGDLVEIELFGGVHANGRVVKRDIDRDLALVEVNVSGTPLSLFAGLTLPLGESVTAVGHPNGLKFTLTRGIISAVRERASELPTTRGSTHLFIQTDTAISPGSSGGPLLLEDKVVGVNTAKLVDVDVEGIGFALHYLEIAQFLAAYQAGN